jgi:ribosome maturation factor RimP
VGFLPTFIFGTREMNKLELTEKIREIAEKIVEKENKLQLVNVKIGGSIGKPLVQIFIDKPNGISHEDCSYVSQQIGEILEDKDFITSEYILEISSPGLERELLSLKDFQEFTGNPAKLRTKKAINGQRNFSGRIKNTENEEIVFFDKTSGEVKIPFSLVAKANLEIDLEEEFKRAKNR